jgi:TolB-like protein
MKKPATSIELHVTQRQLRVDGAVVTLGARAFDVLLALANRRGHIVTKSEIFAAAWPGLTVDDNSLQAQISALRKVLGPNAIATVPQRGYQLIAAPNMRLVVEDARTHASPPAPAEPLIAVLPFDNLSNEPEMQFFCDGVSEEILQRLSRGANLNVIGRTSSFQFRGDRKGEAAAALKCTHILDGTVRRAANHVRLSIHLVDTATQATLWSDRFERNLEDMFVVQDEVAENIAAALNRRFSGDAKEAVDPTVYDLYLHGIRPALTPGDMHARIALLEDVTRRAPNFVCGWGKLAEQRAQLRLLRPYAERDAMAKAVAFEAARAQELDARNPGAQLARYLLLPPWGKFIEAEAIVDRLSTNAGGAGYWLAYIALHLQSVGRVREALEITRRSYELDALNPFVANGMGVGLWYAGRTTEARASFENTLAHWPDAPAPANNLIMLCADLGDWGAVDALLAPARLAKHPLRQFEQGARNYVAAKRAATPAALRRSLTTARDQFQATGFTLNLLTILAHLGARDEAYAMSDTASFTPSDSDDVMGIDAYRTYFLFHASYPQLRADPRFVHLCARLGLVQYWTATKHWPDCADEVPYDFREECMKFAARRLNTADRERRSA